MVVVNTVACRRVLCKLLNIVKVKLKRFGSINGNVISNRLVILISEYNRIYSCLCHINACGINAYVSGSKSLGLAVFVYGIKTDLGNVKCFVNKEGCLTCRNKLKAAFLGLLNYTGERKLEDVLSSTVLTACDSPFTCSYLNLDHYKGVGLSTCNEFDILSSSVGSNNLSILHINAGRTVLNNKSEDTCSGNGNGNLVSVIANLYRLVIFNTVVGLCSVSNLGAGNDCKLAVDVVRGTNACLKVGDVKIILNAFHIVGKLFFTANVAKEVAVCVCALARGKSAICTVVSALCSYVLAHISTALIALVIGISISALGKRLATDITVVILIGINMCAVSSIAHVTLMIAVSVCTFVLRHGLGIVVLKSFTTIITHVVAVSVYVLGAGLLTKEVLYAGNKVPYSITYS